MRAFTALYAALDAATGTSVKVRALVAYFSAAAPADAAWAAYFLTGHRFRRLVKTTDLREAAINASGVPEWLFDACYEAVGDFAETIALLLPGPSAPSDETLAQWVEQRIAPLAGLPSIEVEARLNAAWSKLDRDGRLVYGKVLTGAFRVGVGRELVHRALAQVAGIAVGDVAQRLAGDWQPSSSFWERLRGEDRGEWPAAMHRPYPFCLAYPLDVEPEALGAPEAWQVEWKWDGVRAQLVTRDDATSLWSRGEELISDQFPEIVAAARTLPGGTVLDGELVAWRPDEQHPAAFGVLQRRLGRKGPSARMQRDVPVRMLVFDLLEHRGRDVREMPLAQRRTELEALVQGSFNDRNAPIVVSPTLSNASWDPLRPMRATARANVAEGLMLKRRDSVYAAGRARGIWWKWKIDPFTVDAVLMYAQPGSGRRAGLYTDYTFGVWHQDALVPFAKAYSGLTDAEIREVDAWIRSHTVEKFGPVRSVAPEQVFELAFEAIQMSKRHKSGIAVRFPRIARWRKDKPASEAGRLETLRALAVATT